MRERGREREGGRERENKNDIVLLHQKAKARGLFNCNAELIAACSTRF